MQDGRKTVKVHNVELGDDRIIGRSTLEIRTLQRTDEGVYTCAVIDHARNQNNATHFVRILESGESHIEFSEKFAFYQLKRSAKNKEDAVWSVDYEGHPKPVVNWYDNHGQLIVNRNDRFEVRINKGYTTLSIDPVRLEDMGNYTLEGRNNLNKTLEKKFELIVSGKYDQHVELSSSNSLIFQQKNVFTDEPKVRLEPSYTVRLGEQANLVCKTVGYPASRVTWTFTPCKISPKWPSCEGNRPKVFSVSFIFNWPLKLFRTYQITLCMPTNLFRNT